MTLPPFSNVQSIFGGNWIVGSEGNDFAEKIVILKVRIVGLGLIYFICGLDIIIWYRKTCLVAELLVHKTYIDICGVGGWVSGWFKGPSFNQINAILIFRTLFTFLWNSLFDSLFACFWLFYWNFMLSVSLSLGMIFC